MLLLNYTLHYLNFILQTAYSGFTDTDGRTETIQWVWTNLMKIWITVKNMLGSSNDVKTKTFKKISVGLTEFLLSKIWWYQLVCVLMVQHCTKFLLSLSTKKLSSQGHVSHFKSFCHTKKELDWIVDTKK